MTRPTRLIKCEHCGRHIKSPIALPDKGTFLSGSLAGNRTCCPHCGKYTRSEPTYCNLKDGTIYHGPETLPPGMTPS